MTPKEKARAVRGDWRQRIALDIKDKDAIVHAICPYLRDLKDCKFCPEWTTDHPFKTGEPLKSGCYMVAEEAMNICQTGHPHRHGKQPS